MALKASEVAVGQSFESTVVENLTRTQIVQYAGASGDYNPLHTDEVFATKVAGYPSVFAHGMLTMGMTAKLLTDRVGVDHLLAFGGRFIALVWPGDTLTARATIRELSDAADDGSVLVELDVVTVNAEGTEVFKGQATARAET